MDLHGTCSNVLILTNAKSLTFARENFIVQIHLGVIIVVVRLASVWKTQTASMLMSARTAQLVYVRDKLTVIILRVRLFVHAKMAMRVSYVLMSMSVLRSVMQMLNAKILMEASNVLVKRAFMETETTVPEVNVTRRLVQQIKLVFLRRRSTAGVKTVSSLMIISIALILTSA